MVPKISATYASSTEKTFDQIPFDADHSNMVKFNDISDENYLIVQSRIRQCVKDAPRIIENRFAIHKKGESLF